MSVADDTKKFLAMAVKLSLLEPDQADSLQREIAERDIAPQELASEKGLLTAVELDILTTMLNPERVIPGYQIRDVIGMGGMGVIYRANQIALDREVALKTILLSQIGTPNVAERFQQEARAVARLQHPHIVAAYDFGQVEGRFFFAMEFVDGVNADQYIKREGRLEERVGLSILLQVISGLAEAHEHQIIHRDLKPANLLLTNPPRGYPLPPDVPLVKIADFGLAFLAEQGEDHTRLTSQNSAIGSPNYLAPEQLENEKIDHRVDIYGMGATLYHLLAGEAPFRAKSLNQILSLKLTGKLRPLQELNPDVSRATVDLVEKMMATDPNDRPGGYDEIWDCCSGLLSCDALGTDLANTIRSRSPLMKKPAPPTDADGLDETLVVNASTVRREGAKPAARPTKRWLKWGVLILAIALLGGGGFAWMQTSPVPPRPVLETGRGYILFSGVNLSGWRTAQGQVHPGKGEEGEPLLVIENSAITRMDLCDRIAEFSNQPCPDFYSVEFNVDPSKAEFVLIDFAYTLDGKRWGLRLGREDAALVQAGPEALVDGSEAPFVSVPRENDGPVTVKLWRDEEYWFLYLNQSQIARVPLEQTLHNRERSISLASTGGAAYFSDLMVYQLREPRQTGTNPEATTEPK